MGASCDEARSTACQMLLEVLENQGYSNLVIKQYLRGSKISSRDRAFATALFYGTITRVYTLDYVLNKFLKKEISTLKPFVRTSLRMGAWQILFSYGVKDYAAVDSTVALIKSESNSGAAGLANAVLRRVVSEGREVLASVPQKNLAVRYSLKPEIAGCFTKWFGKEKAESILEALLTEPEVTVRRNILAEGGMEAFEALLSEENLEATLNPEVPDSYTIRAEGKDISDARIFAEGYCTVQSLSAMMVAHVLAPKPGDKVLDTCSAPGGKTTHIAELMHNEGHIDALDASAVRLAMVDESAERLGISIISTLPYDATYLTEEKEILLPEYDAVLCDVPCSGLGLLHRKPDIRLSMTYEKIQSLLPVQKSILENSAFRVREGGTLVYSTCTVDPLENERQIELFLSEHQDFEMEAFDTLLPSALLTNERLAEEAKSGMMTLLPDEGAFDGFFIAKLRRKQNG